MKCQICKCKNIETIETRKRGRENQVYRRKKCLKCFIRFTTYESINFVSRGQIEGIFHPPEPV